MIRRVFCPVVATMLWLTTLQSVVMFAAVPLQSADSHRIQDGTPLKIRINRTVSSADAKVGDNIDFEVLDEIRVADVVVIPKGGIALGTITEAESKRRMGRGGKLNMNIDHVRLSNGDKVPLRAVKENHGGGHVGAMTGAIVATSIVFFPAAPLFLFMHGKDITIPKGTEVTAYVNGDYPIDLVKLTSNHEVNKPAPSQPTSGSVIEATLAVNSSPDAADITVDGKYVGSTPSTLRLSPGDHAILVEKSGFKSWQRTVQIGAGSSITVAATLEKVP